MVKKYNYITTKFTRSNIFGMRKCTLCFFLLVIISCNNIQQSTYFEDGRIDTIELSSVFNLSKGKSEREAIFIQRNPDPANPKISCSRENQLDSIKYFFNSKNLISFQDSIIFPCSECCGMNLAILVLFWENGKLTREKWYSLYYKKLIEDRKFDKNFTLLNTWNYKGFLESVVKFVKGEIKDYTVWYESGNVREKQYIYLNRRIVKYWYESGKLKEEVVWDIDTGKKVSTRSWCENGNLSDSALFDVGEFRRISYFCSGQIQQVWSYINSPDFPIEILEFYENGNPKFTGKFKRISEPPPGGIPDGKWKYFSIDGDSIKTEFYLNGELLKTTLKIITPNNKVN